MSKKKLAQTYHNLALMLNAGVPILKALKTCAASRSSLARIFDQIHRRVSKGEDISQAMADHTRTFAPLDMTIVTIGQETGSLAESLEHLAQWYEFRHKMTSRIRSGLLMPILLIHAAALIAPIVPFALNGFDLALYFKGLVSILAVFYIPAAAILAVICLTPRKGPLRRILDILILMVPVVRGAVKNLDFSRFTRAFYITCSAGLPYVRCAEIAAEMVVNTEIKSWFAGAAPAARKGRQLSEGFTSSIPADLLNIWRTGEETGDLDDVAKKLADETSYRAQASLEELARWTPRIIYFCVMLIAAWQIIKGAQMLVKLYDPSNY